MSIQWGAVKAARRRSWPCVRVQWELLNTVECCEICDEWVVNLHKSSVECCESCKERVVTLHVSAVGAVKDSRAL